ncbi:hypothetical protein [Bacillus velezensis]|uniref:hypothetical protein n=1 Tax=Bacillus velezensis TaxID=492670 RepID=UPI0009F42BE7|nr:hypothetical protein [Bacillus velezensis]OQV53338.1 hypothetical protein B5Z20_03220 [Bacillus velezensis]OQV55361.1 hypothetical protein B5Z22_08085 [Bacillus velezensis]OQV60852.1 hypothetical protein B5Z24_08090 [Bacillus velezensis]OQV61919.1 hypothetical protein B5Z23_08075 [Bacillus velezensis]
MSGKLTKDQLEEIRQRADAATEGPWRIGKQSPNGLNNIGTIGGLLTAQTTDEDDAKYIAHARRDIPVLLDHIEELQGKIDLYESYAQECDYYAILTEMGDENDNV